MPSDLPDFYFRIRDNGAFVFRVGRDDRQRRLGLDQIAAVNIRNGEIKPQGDHVLDDEETAVIRKWMVGRRALLAARQAEEIRATIESINLTAQWVQTKASPEELDGVADDLLMAMHDLRGLIVRKRADAMTRQEAASQDSDKD
ncbi:hypothetical protein [Pseudooceanicola algae]|uniref:Uncharacterized protein n=1 Tax=Pseudooceanicola algae TaxID=1537215 RepID=A0A418SGR1_9RHOB|nr:hypothetical protein [Pseudooceanicola algae]QPM88892.1 hypothetical protein PSAL_000950 [Pseudooceanicola algae]